MAVLVVSFGSEIITARSFGAKNRYRVNADRELVGFGAANIASGLFGGFAVTGADSRTAVNDAIGGRTQLAGLVAAAAMIVALAVLTDILRFLRLPPWAPFSPPRPWTSSISPRSAGCGGPTGSSSCWR